MSFLRKFFLILLMFLFSILFIFSNVIIFPHLRKKEVLSKNLIKNKNLILLNSAIFDPIRDEEPNLSKYVENREKFSGNKFRYFIVQFKGKITPQKKMELIKNGYKIYWYIPNNALLVGMDVDGRNKIENLKDVRWVGDYQPGYKISDEIASFLIKKSYPFDKEIPELGVILFNGSDVTKVINALSEEFGFDKSFSFNIGAGGEYLDIKISDKNVSNCIRFLSNLSEVLSVDVVHKRTLKNNNSIWVCQSGDSATHATTIFDHGIMGQGEIVGVTDSGVRSNSCFFINADGDDPIQYNYTSVPPPGDVTYNLNYRKIIGYNVLSGADFGDEESNHYHGTHVCGSVGGDNLATPATLTDPGHDSGDGMAPLAKIFFEDSGAVGSGGLAIPPVFDLWEQIYNVGAKIASNSWGGGEGGYYDSSCVFTDYFTYLHEDFLVFFAAGNAGPLGDTLDYEANAKNIVTVGATKNGSTGAMDLASFSSKGPAGDGRYKPDLCAPGENIISAFGGSDCATWSMSGTSMATPTAAGLAALVRCYYDEGFYPSGEESSGDKFNPSAALVKATLINSCVNMTGVNTSGGLGGKEDAPSNGQGWGRIQLDNALYFDGDSRKLIVNDCRNDDGLTTGMERDYSFTVNSSNESLKITLVWSDPPAVSGSLFQLVDDLDLVVVAPDGTVYKGNQWNDQTSGDLKESQPNPSGKDDINNVEQIYIKSPQTGVYTLKIIGANVPGFRNFNKQGYAFVITGDVSNSNVSYLNIEDLFLNEKSGNGDNLIDPGESFYIMPLLKNDGSSDFHNVSATISTSFQGVTIDNPTINYGDISAGGSATSSSSTPVINFSDNIERGIDIPFTFSITSDEGTFTREFSLRVVNSPGPPVLRSVSIEDNGEALGKNYPQYEDISLNLDFSDPNFDTKYIYVLFYVNGEYLFTLKEDLSQDNVYGETEISEKESLYPFAFFATNVGESVKVGVLLEDADSNFSSLVFSNEITLISGGDAQTVADLNDDDSVYIPLNFNFPFYEKDYSGIWVNSDGNISLSAGYSWQDRSPAAFSEFMPRIAPLYSDIAKDSGNAGEMSVDSGSNYITVSWNSVGQWSDSGPVGSNTFSVTLKDSGEIDFNYGHCSVSASQSGYKAIVGITPGDSYPLEDMDFSSVTSEIYYPSNKGLYHVYRDGDTFDLSGKTIVFMPGEATLNTVKTIYFPVLNFGSDKNTGYGFVNPSKNPAAIKFTAYDEDGNVIDTSSNFLWKPENQGAYEVGSIFSGFTGSVGWLKAETDCDSLRGFFLAEDLSNSSLIGLDGASGIDDENVNSDDKIISEIKTTGDFNTTLYVVNLSNSDAAFNISGYPVGLDVVYTQDVTIPSNGVFVKSVSELFQNNFDGYVKISSSGSAKFIANALIRDGNKSISSLNGVDVNNATKTLYVPHAVYWKDLYYTEVSLVNTEGTSATVNVYFYDENGNLNGSPLTYTIPSYGVKVLRDADLGLDTSVQKSLGWVKIESDKKLIGSMEFGNPEDDHYRATLPLMLSGKDDIYFSQVANGTLGSVNYWTGLALINPSDEDVRVNVSVYLSDGEMVGNSGTFILKSHEKLVNMLRGVQNLENLPDQSSGYVHIKASAPIFAFELFGDSALNFISSVNAQ